MHQLRVVWFLHVLLLPAALAAAQSQADFLVADSATPPKVRVDSHGRMHLGLTKTFASPRFSYVALYDSTGQLECVSEPIGGAEATQLMSVPGPQKTLIVWVDDQRGTFNSYIVGSFANMDADSLSPTISFNDSYGDAIRFRPTACWLSDTTFVVAWDGQGPQTQDISGVYGTFGSVSTPRTGSNLLFSDHTSVTRSNSVPRLATHEFADRFAVVWLQGDSKGNSVRLRFFSKAGNALGPSIAVAQADTSACVGSPAAAMYANGDVMIAWSAGEWSGNWSAILRRYTKEGIPLSDSVVITAAAEPDLDITLQSDGKGIVVWQSVEPPASRIRAQRLNSDGSLSGESFLVAAKIDSIDQIRASAGIRDDLVYVAWAEWPQVDQIRARIFHFNDSPVGVQNEDTLLDGHALSLEAYPNPFNASTQVRFFVGSETNVAISVYNVLGQEIARPFMGRPQAGAHTVEWSGANCTSGVYFCRIRAGSLFRTVKLLLVR